MCVSPISQAVVVDRTVYISGQLGLDVASGQLVDGGVQAQAKQVRHRTARTEASLVLSVQSYELIFLLLRL